LIDQENLTGQEMENVEGVYVIENLEQLRAIADPLRTRILEALVREPKTTSQLAELLGETNNKLHYHVHELERFGLIKLVEKRERGGVLEKYYRAVARDYTIAPALLGTSSSSEVITIIRDHFDQIVQGIAQSLERIDPNVKPSVSLSINRDTLWMTEEEFQELVRQFDALIAPFLEPRSSTGERSWLMYFVAHSGPQDKDRTDKA
jgi:DNA-binding transcriptional ArsR family regulator